LQELLNLPHTTEVQTTTKCTKLGEGHGIECPIEMQPSIKPTRLLEGHAIEDKGRTRHGDIGHITKVHIGTFLRWWELDNIIIEWCGMAKLDSSQHWQICWNEIIGEVGDLGGS
jgi:hypothetical protein